MDGHKGKFTCGDLVHIGADERDYVGNPHVMI